MIHENERGGKQSKIQGSMTEVPPIALRIISEVMGEGAKNYPRDDGRPNWHKISCKSNLDHALLHYANAQVEANRGSEMHELYIYEELSHCAARMMMALEQFVREGYNSD